MVWRVELLLKHGAKTNIRNKSGDTPLKVAKLYKDECIVELLREHGSVRHRLRGAISSYKSTTLSLKHLFGMRTSQTTTIRRESAMPTPRQEHFYYMVGQGELEYIKRSLDADATLINSRGRGGAPSLNAAAQKGDEAMVALLLSNKADINATDDSDITALEEAAGAGHRTIVELLLNIKNDNKRIWSALNRAAYCGRTDVLELLLSKYTEVNNTEYRGRDSPLHAAAAGGRYDVARLLIAKKADVRAENSARVTPLHKAAANGHRSVAELLLASGAKVNAGDGAGDTPLHRAVENEKNEMVRFLLESKANINAKNAKGFTPLHLSPSPSGHRADGRSTEYHHVELLRLLLANGANVNAQSKQGDTPLHFAAYHLNVDLVEELLKGGANPQVRNSSGRVARPFAPNSVLGYFQRRQYERVVQLLDPESAYRVHALGKMPRA